MGHVISSEGICFDEERIKSIRQFPEPKNKKDVQKLLGTINFLNKSIPKLAEISTPIRSLLKNDVNFVWLPVHTKSLELLKKIISEAPKLKPLDPCKEIVIQADASKHGVGCCLMQDGYPI